MGADKKICPQFAFDDGAVAIVFFQEAAAAQRRVFEIINAGARARRQLQAVEAFDDFDLRSRKRVSSGFGERQRRR